jgi:general secretion pathway protein C
MITRLSSFFIWVLVAGAAVFWALRLFVSPSVAPVSVLAVNEIGNVRGDWSRLMGIEEAPVLASAVPQSSRFRLLGVMAGKAREGELTPGLALISIDGKPPRTYAAGARIDDHLIVQSLSLRSASLGAASGPDAGVATFVLQVPPLSAPNTGTLPAPASLTEPSPSFAPASLPPPTGFDNVANPSPPSMGVPLPPTRPLRTQPNGRDLAR